MIKHRSRTAPGPRNHSKDHTKQDRNKSLPSARIHISNIANTSSLSLVVPSNISTPKSPDKNNVRLCRRATSAPTATRLYHSNSVLDIRGKHFEQNGKTFDMMSYLKAKSFPRRIHRLINEAPNKTLENEDSSSSPTENTDAEDTLSVSLNNKQLLERRRGLHRQRFMNRSWVSVLHLTYSLSLKELNLSMHAHTYYSR